MTLALEHASTTGTSHLLTSQLLDRLAQRITADHPDIDTPLARRAVVQAAAFVAASGRIPGQALAPSPLVDIAWHTFILHTVDYAAFCERIVGRFVHHVPTDDEATVPGGSAETRARTLAAITMAGYTIDHGLWPEAAAECSQCHAGCSDSPNTGKK
ncbi:MULTISPECIES: glycine-rich domain-containing protein [Streptomyces]|uniref:Uncharacterized conserved protein n=1 Tax=Streptomyces griseus TaxID=1911 RepID=A0A380NBI4_STRGR|nr:MULTISPECIES: hypothetical protein [Streptomyces]MDQ0297059.1 hypothetical protein [Streptomyces sp. DSM 41037]RPK84332.1 hypothetical protein EES47_23735 [Streptomyces sp. ADI98-12]WPR50124.1 hypothetical protein SJI45_02520 [Streptomyces sp. S399]SUP35301.1 Uncharacterized conserved protein [Streptomyces griseus]GFH67005.1 hypothetical protein Srut_35190 [Streptomyces rutgersensis]